MNSKSFNIIQIFLGMIILFFLFTIFFNKDRISEISVNYDLEKDGVCVIPNVLQEYEINEIRKLSMDGKYQNIKNYLNNHYLLKQLCLKQTGKDYVFQDYIWIIKKSTIHTCHRDNNGDFFNEGQKYPSYTVLVYLEPMEKCLGVIPRSHYKKNSYSFNLNDPVIHLTCNPGDVIIFNANLIHVGPMNNKSHHLRCQMKLSHKEDLHTLHYYQNFNKVLNEENNVPEIVRHIQKRGSCSLPILSDLMQQESVRTVRGSKNGNEVGIFQKIFSYLFYGNKDYYDLPNAF